MKELLTRSITEITEEIPFIVKPSKGFQKAFSDRVILAESLFSKLVLAQTALSETNGELVLILKRGYFPRTESIVRKERISKTICKIIYPHLNVNQIFENEPYGHHEGTGCDIGVYDSNNERYALSFLPIFNVFSPQWLLDIYEHDEYLETLYTTVCSAIVSTGIKIHPNLLEARQIHCYEEKI